MDYICDAKLSEIENVSDIKEIKDFDNAKLNISKLGKTRGFAAYPGKKNGLKIPPKVVRFIKTNKKEYGIFVVINLKMAEFFHLFVYHFTHKSL